MRSVAVVLLLLASASAAILALAPIASATTYVRGQITVNTVWGLNDTTYVVTSDVTVKAPAKLTITPGTTVKFDPAVHLFVEGSLAADGTSARPITFGANNTASLIPWTGIQFNASSAGSVSWATFDRVDRAISATSSSPTVTSNTVIQAGIGFAFVGSSTVLSSNTIQRATFLGVYANASNLQILDNRINGTALAIQVEQPGTSAISRNTITNVSSAFAVGILITSGATAAVDGNVVRSVRGANGGNGIAPGAPGRDGALGIGIYVSGAPSASITGNTIDAVLGGRGGDGAANPAGTGGRGGNGGAAAGIAVALSSGVSLAGNTITSMTGGSGGAGGGGGTTTFGGRGGDGGTAVAVETVATKGSTQLYTSTINGIVGGAGGVGGVGATTSGSGGLGGDGDGIFFISSANPDATGNSLQVLRGGIGGNAGLSTGVAGNGATGGAATGLSVFSVVGTAVLHSNTVDTLTGGDGGRGSRGGYGGNATAILVLGNNDGLFNATLASANQISAVTGGVGGIGSRFGGNGGAASGIGVVFVSPSLATDSVLTLQGGRGGDALDGSDGGRGGDAYGVLGGIVANGRSVGDIISGVAKGAAGSGPPVQTSNANGYYFIGNASFSTRFTVENASFSAVRSYEFFVDNYTDAVAVNSPFTTFAVMAAGTLTVKNYLEVDVFWPNAFTPAAGARILVEDNGSPVWDRIAPTGFQPWILATDRVYVNSNTPTDNRTQVTVSYLSYNFANNPRSVDMGASHTETFVMVDKEPPTSAADPLPTYENSVTFTVGYTASDGNGTGLATITLWYRTGGGWTPYATQSAGTSGQFTFTGSADGLYEFATTADDVAGNTQPGPSANNTWTIVDTVRPGSHVNPLTPYQTAASFAVSWAPDAGVTDIVAYTIQYNAGFGWTSWLVDTTATSGTFNSGSQGPYAFRSLAKDAAGNVEPAPAGNDTWTIVDTIRPSSQTLPLPAYETSLNFTVSWGPVADSFDIASYLIQVRDNGVGWTDWLTSTTAGSASYTGQDGHTYEFRSIATDRAGNTETVGGPDSWTRVDGTPPDSTMTALPAYENTLQFPIAWGPVAGTTDIVAYRVQFRDGAGAWTDLAGYTNTTATVGTFVGQDAHVYAFRTIATDRAGNVEVPPAGNDTWTKVDVTPPSVTATAPVGANTGTSPSIVITFSEPMARNSVEQAFSITPAIDGAFQWSADSRVMTFVPSRPLQSGTTYFVVVDSTARDLAGNSMTQSKTFQFATAAGFADFWWVFLLIGAGVAGALFFIFRRRSQGTAAPAKPVTASKASDAIIEDVFLLYHRDGILIKHETRRLRPDVDTDILSGMLTAVQAFVKDALRGDDYAELNEMTVGQMHILIGRGKWLVLAARIEGDATESWTGQIERCIKDMEDHHWDQLEDWDGDMALARVLTPYVKKLIQGGYAGPIERVLPA